jgi:ribosomal-protein-alanine N-acetyltransferase
MTKMPLIAAERLHLLALTADQLRLYLVQPDQLERELDLRPGLTPPEPALRRAIGLKLVAMGEVKKRLWPWSTYWLLMIAAEQTAAGLAGFKGAPDDSGQVEIGYGVEPVFRRLGYATEAVAALVDWAFSWPDCQTVIARTPATNEASMTVLRRVGFRQAGVEEETLLWQINKRTNEIHQS